MLWEFQSRPPYPRPCPLQEVGCSLCWPPLSATWATRARAGPWGDGCGPSNGENQRDRAAAPCLSQVTPCLALALPRPSPQVPAAPSWPLLPALKELKGKVTGMTSALSEVPWRFLPEGLSPNPPHPPELRIPLRTRQTLLSWLLAREKAGHRSEAAPSPLGRLGAAVGRGDSQGPVLGPQPREVKREVGRLGGDSHLSLRWSGFSERVLGCGWERFNLLPDGWGMGPTLGRPPL